MLAIMVVGGFRRKTCYWGLAGIEYAEVMGDKLEYCSIFIYIYIWLVLGYANDELMLVRSQSCSRHPHARPYIPSSWLIGETIGSEIVSFICGKFPRDQNADR